VPLSLTIEVWLAILSKSSGPPHPIPYMTQSIGGHHGLYDKTRGSVHQHLPVKCGPSGGGVRYSHDSVGER